MYRLCLLLGTVSEYFSRGQTNSASAEYEIKLKQKVWFSTVTAQDLYPLTALFFLRKHWEAVLNHVASDDARPSVISQHNSSDFTLQSYTYSKTSVLWGDFILPWRTLHVFRIKTTNVTQLYTQCRLSVQELSFCKVQISFKPGL